MSSSDFAPHRILAGMPSKMKNKFRLLSNAVSRSSQNNCKMTGDEANDIESVSTSLFTEDHNVKLRLDASKSSARIASPFPCEANKETSLQTRIDVDLNAYLVPGFYFLLGAFLATPSLAIRYFAIRVLAINPGSFGALYGIVASPWFFKPLYGLISDTRPLFGKHRAPYLVICSALATCMWILVAVPGRHSRSSLGFGVLMVLGNVFVCFCDVIVDCMVAKAAREEMDKHKGRTQTRAWMCRHSGTLFGIVLGGYLVANVRNLHVAFAVTAVFPLLMLVGAVFLREKRSEMTPLQEHHHRRSSSYFAASVAFCSPSAVTHHKSMWSQLRKAARSVHSNKTLMNLALYYFIFSATPNSSVTFSYYLINEIRLSESFMAWLSIVGCVAMMIGLAIYQNFFVHMSTRRIIRISIVAGTVLSLVPLVLVTGLNRDMGIDDRFFVLGDDVAESLASQLSMIPMQITVASMCPEGEEGLVYAGFMSISNFGGAVSTWLGALFTHWLGITKTDYTNMWLLVALCSATNVVPYFFTKWLPPESASKTKKSLFDVNVVLSDLEK